MSDKAHENNPGIMEPLVLPNVKKVVAILSGKGGVGKSTTTALLACEFARRNFKVGILDADVTGPSIPKLFGVNKKLEVKDDKLQPAITKSGIKVISLNLLLPSEDDPVIWRGPMLSKVIKEFWEQVDWGDLDYLFVDLPPGTSDVLITVFQSIPVDGAIVVTTPQDLASLIVRKSMKMVKRVKNGKLFGIVENMSYFVCPDNQKEYYIFGSSKVEKIAMEYGIEVLAKVPIDPVMVQMADEGKIEDYSKEIFSHLKI